MKYLLSEFKCCRTCIHSCDYSKYYFVCGLRGRTLFKNQGSKLWWDSIDITTNKRCSDYKNKFKK